MLFSDKTTSAGCRCLLDTSEATGVTNAGLFLIIDLFI